MTEHEHDRRQGEEEDQDVVATFRDRETAEEAARAAQRSGVGPERVSVDRPADEDRAVRQQIADEGQDVVAGPGVVATGGMTRGFTFWTVVGALAGAAMGALIGIIPFYDMSVGARVAIVAVCGAVAGAVAGFTWGGGVGPIREGEEQALAGERGVTVGISGDDPQTGRAASELEGKGPERVDRPRPEGETRS
jgi:hypothetical protein